MLQVLFQYSTRYHLKASKGIALVDKISENLAVERQQEWQKVVKLDRKKSWRSIKKAHRDNKFKL
jgi:hypothetical protein